MFDHALPLHDAERLLFNSLPVHSKVYPTSLDAFMNEHRDAGDVELQQLLARSELSLVLFELHRWHSGVPHNRVEMFEAESTPRRQRCAVSVCLSPRDIAPYTFQSCRQWAHHVVSDEACETLP